MRESTKFNGKRNKGWKPAAKRWQKETTAANARIYSTPYSQAL